MKVDLPTEDTLEDLVAFIKEVFPNGLVDTSGAEIIIKTGLGLDMPALVYGLDEDDLAEIRGE